MIGRKTGWKKQTQNAMSMPISNVGGMASPTKMVYVVVHTGGSGTDEPAIFSTKPKAIEYFKSLVQEIDNETGSENVGFPNVAVDEAVAKGHYFSGEHEVGLWEKSVG